MKDMFGKVTTYTLSLCIAGLASLTPSWAQEAPSAPDVHVETHVFEVPSVQVESPVIAIPKIHVQGQILEIPSIHLQTDIDENGIVRIVQGQAAGKVKNLLTQAQGADALNKYTVAQVYQNLSTIYSPEMAKKTREIALLRQMLNLKLSARDIEQALPLLRELKNADKVVPAKPEQAIDEEYNQLLRARPGDPIPASSAEAFRDAASGFRSRKQAIWDRMGQQIGKEKANGIRAMLRTESNFTWSNGTGLQQFFAPTTPVAPRIRTRPESAPRVRPAQPPADPLLPDNPTSLNPLDGRGRAAGDSKAGTLQGGAVGGQTGNAARIAQSRLARQAGGQTDADEAAREKEQEARERAKEARDKEKDERKAAARAQRGTTSNGYVLAPQARALTLDGSGRRIFFTTYGQASLDELIDLFERKLAVMRR